MHKITLLNSISIISDVNLNFGVCWLEHHTSVEDFILIVKQYLDTSRIAHIFVQFNLIARQIEKNYHVTNCSWSIDYTTQC